MPAGHHFDTEGNAISAATFAEQRGRWLPSPEDRAYLKEIQKPVTEPGKIANWVAPPARGINGQPFEFEYVRHES
jgi:benzoyl-CoA 2,3-dioxygenase component B